MEEKKQNKTNAVIVVKHGISAEEVKRSERWSEK